MQLFFAILKLSEFNKPSFKGLANERKKKKSCEIPATNYCDSLKKKSLNSLKLVDAKNSWIKV